MATLEFFFDCSSPWTYLAFTRVQAVLGRTGANIVWKPILVGGVFNAVNQDVYERRANPDARKGRYSAKDLQDWARLTGLRIKMPPSIFPVRATLAMRSALAAQDEGKLIEFSKACFEAYWSHDRDIAAPQVIKDVCGAADLNGDHILEKAQTNPIKDRLRANTDEVIARGGFGSPTMFVNGDDMYFGNDRMELVEAALTR
ncbi:MAG: 2-hydroxychromene-2-carboxylate isomerase [Alphaproteobacteria bacterium]|nr:2-hydroxychromene-2-carboxylate isomerase [Alphaproteobacteria bacterium]MBL6940149.1 2-hydroxychromene-2-carboxylate isomerase [Alphaproteobacteria bacterium]MBL7100236.1 2-hydroxychromene-2-carboxylate isomerase [Alphaproteobacteria bacterium]